ncbi:hypothetical protein Cal6303_3071 [Calothrix sp. PCC 6303]|nr:hypothetical protein Cal6303_3071 [Calothrix sp. PCC 6303]
MLIAKAGADNQTQRAKILAKFALKIIYSQKFTIFLSKYFNDIGATV